MSVCGGVGYVVLRADPLPANQCKRIVTVRELARSQGFPDWFRFVAVDHGDADEDDDDDDEERAGKTEYVKTVCIIPSPLQAEDRWEELLTTAALDAQADRKRRYLASFGRDC
jgi:hypothetical protein